MSPLTLPAWSEVAAEVGSVHRLLVGFSGGLDSTVLLYLARQWSIQSGLPLLAVHVNHQLSPHAAHWQSHCQSVCAQWNIAFHADTVSVVNAGQGLEAAARNARYEVYARVAVKGDLLLLGHHQDDQAETVLQRLLRGSGVLGLRGMERYAAFRHFYLYRPLLTCSRSQLHAFAWAHREGEPPQAALAEMGATRCRLWHWIEDESNTSDRFDRNFLRHRVVPLLRARWPQAVQAIERSSQHCADAQQLLDERAHEDLLPRLHSDGGLQLCDGGRASTALFVPPLSPARVRNLLRYWWRQQHIPLPSEAQLDQILSQLIPAPSDAEPVVQWGTLQIRRYRQRIYVVPCLPPPHAFTLPLSPDELRDKTAHPLPTGGYLRLHPECGVHAMRLSGFEAGVVNVRFRQGGETCKLVGRPTRPLKKLLQESAVPPWWRDRLPLIYIADELVAIPGLGVCEGFQAMPGETGVVLEWQPPGFHQSSRDPSGKC